MHEADRLASLLIAGDAPRASRTLRRMLTILKTMVAQIDVLETMSPIDFLSFRDFLSSASGFQSWQFRAFEFAFGNKNAKALERYPADSTERTALEKRLAAPTIWDAFLRFIAGHGHTVPPELLSRDVTAPIEESAALQQTLVGIYREQRPEASICELLVDFDEGVQEWRYRHVKMVERTIGFKQGTGGSPGAAYLRTTLFKPFFPDLWTIRSQL